jgi:hypothetical protein
MDTSAGSKLSLIESIASELDVKLPEYDEESDSWVKNGESYNSFLDSIYTFKELEENRPDEEVVLEYAPISDDMGGNIHNNDNLRELLEDLRSEYEDNEDIDVLTENRVSDRESGILISAPLNQTEEITPEESDKYELEAKGYWSNPQPIRETRAEFVNSVLEALGFQGEHKPRDFRSRT